MYHLDKFSKTNWYDLQPTTHIIYIFVRQIANDMRNLLLFLTSFLCVLPLSGQERIQMRQESGVYTVPCTVNGLRLRFIFDTGASNVTISATEALFMLKNEYLTEDDFLAKGAITLADGSIQENTVINLKEVKVGSITLENVQAVVMNNISAPLLLGQSAIAKLQPWHFDGDVLVLGAASDSSDELQTYINTLDAKRCIAEGLKYEERGNLGTAIRFFKQACNLKSYDGYYHYLKFTSRHLKFVEDPLPLDNFAEAAINNHPELIKWLKEYPPLPTTYCKYDEDMIDLVNVYEALINKGHYYLCLDASYKASNPWTDMWTKGLRFLQLGAENGYAECMYEYAKAYDPNIEHSRAFYPYEGHNKTKALTWYKKAILNGNTDAVSYYAELVFGDLSSSSTLKTETFNTLREAGHKGNEDAISLLMEIYINGRYGYTEDTTKALYWAKKAVEIAKPSGSLFCFAHEYLGYTYYYNNDYSNSLKHFTALVENKAPVRSLPSSTTYLILGEIYFFGKGTSTDYKKALSFYTTALSMESDAYEAYLNYRIAYMYNNGLGTDVNKKKGFTYMLAAAKAGDADAQADVAFAYYMGEVVAENLQQTKYWYEKAAAQGHVFANYFLGRSYKDGILGSTDLSRAIQYLSKAAENNYDDAIYQLGLIYEEGGQGVQRNYRLAGEYFKKAADLGHEQAKEKYKSYQ